MDIQALLALLEQGPLTADHYAEIHDETTGMDRAMGLRYTQISRSGVTAELPIGPQLMQPFGLVHGGTYCAVAESVGSFAGCLAAGMPVVGLSNETNFIRPAASGTIVATAAPLHLGKTTQLWEITCSLDEKVLAKTLLRTMVMR